MFDVRVLFIIYYYFFFLALLEVQNVAGHRVAYSSERASAKPLIKINIIAGYGNINCQFDSIYMPAMRKQNEHT